MTGGGSGENQGPINADGTFTYTFNSKPLGIKLANIGAFGVKVSKVNENRLPIEAGDLLLKLDGTDISKMTLQELGGKLREAEYPLSITFLRPSYHTET